MNQELYEIYPLLGPRDIRVIDIESAASFDDPIVASIRIITLYESRDRQGTSFEDATAPGREYIPLSKVHEELNYQTLSYAWGTLYKDATICIAGFHVPVTSHLLTGLKRIREHMQAQQLQRITFDATIWIDALCIDQSDAKERAHQVGFMGDIYEQSYRLIIWLGESWMTGPATTSHPMTAIHYSESPHILMKHMISCPYFYRRWIIQEVRKAHWHNIEILAGSLRVEYHELEWFVRNIERSAPLLRHEFEHSEQTLLDNMMRYFGASCEQPLDRVYALLGISSDHEMFPADYTLSPEDLYIDLARRWLQDSANVLRVLTAAALTNHSEEATVAVPSWVPNWAEPHPSAVPGDFRNSPGQSLLCEVPFRASRILKLRGWVLHRRRQKWLVKTLLASAELQSEARENVRHVLLLEGFEQGPVIPNVAFVVRLQPHQRAHVQLVAFFPWHLYPVDVRDPSPSRSGTLTVDESQYRTWLRDPEKKWDDFDNYLPSMLGPSTIVEVV